MSLLAANSNLEKIVQTNTLARYLGDALFPALLFRGSAKREKHAAGEGPTGVGTVRGLMQPNTKPRRPGEPRPFRTNNYEHYLFTVEKYGDAVAIDMPSSYVTITPAFWEDQHALALEAAQTLNRLPRNELFRRYLAGHAIVDAVGGGGTVLTVSSLNGFRESVDTTTGIPVATSNVAPRTFSRNGIAIPAATSQIIDTTPADANWPDGPGTITLSADVGFVAGNRIDATDASIIIRPGLAPTVDAIGAGDVLTMDLIRQAVQSLRQDNIGPCSDGHYHVHFDPAGETALFRDNSFQRQIETRGLDDDPYLTFAVGRANSCDFFSNNENPAFGTVDADSIFDSRPVTAANAQMSAEIGAELVNATGVQIMRTIVIGGGALVEKYVDETAYMSDAGVAGRVGGYRVVNNDVEIPMDGIRWILKAPQDQYNETLTAAWSYTAAWTAPTNRLSGRSAATYKRARVIETALINPV